MSATFVYQAGIICYTLEVTLASLDFTVLEEERDQRAKRNHHPRIKDKKLMGGIMN